jgi:hypothetical protein
MVIAGRGVLLLYGDSMQFGTFVCYPGLQFGPDLVCDLLSLFCEDGIAPLYLPQETLSSDQTELYRVGE